MKEIERKKNTSLYLKIFESKEYNCTIFIYLDKDDNVISMNFHWGTMTINPKYMEFNGDGEATQLYKLFLKILGSHSPKIYDMVISACSLNTPKDFKIKSLEREIANYELKLKEANAKLDKVYKLINE